jgi:hypothetical protein
MKRIYLMYALSGLSALLLYKIVSKPEMQNFKVSEFGVWYPLMDKDLLSKLDTVDTLAKQQGIVSGIMISPAAGSLGRHNGTGQESYHNVDFWGSVKAADVMPFVYASDGSMESLSGSQQHAFYNLAVQVGFGGIGVAPDWKPLAGFHLDVRPISKFYSFAERTINGVNVVDLPLNQGFIA